MCSPSIPVPQVQRVFRASVTVLLRKRNGCELDDMLESSLEMDGESDEERMWTLVQSDGAASPDVLQCRSSYAYARSTYTRLQRAVAFEPNGLPSARPSEQLLSQLLVDRQMAARFEASARQHRQHARRGNKHLQTNALRNKIFQAKAVVGGVAKRRKLRQQGPQIARAWERY